MSQLQAQLNKFTQFLTESEYQNYKTVLALASGGLIRAPRSDNAGSALTVATDLLAASRKRAESASFGVAWRGRPDFLTDKILQDLRDESRRLRPRAYRVEDHKVVHSSHIAKEFAQSAKFLEFVKLHAGGVVSTERATYLYYDEVGMGIDPHIDNPEFALNAILMLEHKYSESPSALTFYQGNDKRRVHLHPGELILFYADSVIHARERMKDQEFLAVVAFGFQPC